MQAKVHARNGIAYHRWMLQVGSSRIYWRWSAVLVYSLRGTSMVRSLEGICQVINIAKPDFPIFLKDFGSISPCSRLTARSMSRTTSFSWVDHVLLSLKTFGHILLVIRHLKMVLSRCLMEKAMKSTSSQEGLLYCRQQRWIRLVCDGRCVILLVFTCLKTYFMFLGYHQIDHPFLLSKASCILVKGARSSMLEMPYVFRDEILLSKSFLFPSTAAHSPTMTIPSRRL